MGSGTPLSTSCPGFKPRRHEKFFSFFFPPLENKQGCIGNSYGGSYGVSYGDSYVHSLGIAMGIATAVAMGTAMGIATCISWG